MADMTRFQFDSSQVEPKKVFKPIPAGAYTAVIVDSEMKTTAAGTGEYLKIVFEVIDGDHKGRRLYENLNVDNPNQTAVKIARETLSAICRAIGVGVLSDSSMLHDKPLIIKVSVDMDTETKVKKNNIRDYIKVPSVSSTPNAPWLKKA
jgi:hypothetical protein